MSYQRRAYDDQDSTREMVDDCLACQHQLARTRGVFDPIAVEPAPSLSYDDIGHYQKIVKILSETDRIMREIELPLD